MPHRSGLTKRLPPAHPGINVVRETLQTHVRTPADRSVEKATSLTPTGSRITRSGPRALALLVLLVLGLTTAGPAAAASCGKRVIDDWYSDGRVDGTYPLHCYDDAIEALPRDVRDYSSAKEDIERAMQARMRGEDPPPATSDPDGDPGTGGPSDGSDGPGEVGVKGEGTDGDPEATPPVDPASSDSIPVPLLVLAGLALLLVAAGSVGYVLRRQQARRVPPGAL